MKSQGSGILDDRAKKVRNDRAAAAVLMMYRRRWTLIRVLDILLRPLGWLSKSVPPPEIEEVRSVLVFEHGNLGDVVMHSPFFRSLRAYLPDAHIAVMGKSSVRSFLLEQGFADEFIPVRAPWVDNRGGLGTRYIPFSPIWLRFLAKMLRLRGRGFDLSLALAGKTDIRHNLMLWLTGARRRVGYGYAGGGCLLTDNLSPDLLNPSETALTLQLLKGLGISPSGGGNLLRVRSEDRKFADEFLRKSGVNDGDLVIGVHSGARAHIRRWGEENFRDVARSTMARCGAKVLWFSDPVQTAANSTGSEFIPVSLPLDQFLAVLSRCRLLLCNDSGPMHLAGGLGIPVVAVFGPTQPEWFAPVGEGHEIVIRRDMWCRPCADRCIFPEAYCLTLVPVEQVTQAVIRKLQTTSRRTIENLISIS